LKLFEKIGSDQFYIDVKNNILPWHASAKSYWQSLFKKHADFLDANYINDFSIDCFSRLWELSQLDFLASHGENGLKLFKLTGKASKPDFGFDIHDKSFYLEAICASAGNRAGLNFVGLRNIFLL
jgi:hypothetical protein